MKPICHLDNSLRVKLSAAAKACIGIFMGQTVFTPNCSWQERKQSHRFPLQLCQNKTTIPAAPVVLSVFYSILHTASNRFFLKKIHKKLQGSLTVAVTAGFHVMIASLHTKLCTFAEVSARCKWSLAFWQFYREKSYPPGVKGKPLQRTPNPKSF